MDESIHFKFQGQVSLLSDRSSLERDALLLVADESVTRSILTTAQLEDHSRVMHRKPDFMFRDATSILTSNLLPGEGGVNGFIQSRVRSIMFCQASGTSSSHSSNR